MRTVRQMGSRAI